MYYKLAYNFFKIALSWSQKHFRFFKKKMICNILTNVEVSREEESHKCADLDERWKQSKNNHKMNNLYL